VFGFKGKQPRKSLENQDKASQYGSILGYLA